VRWILALVGVLSACQSGEEKKRPLAPTSQPSARPENPPSTPAPASAAGEPVPPKTAAWPPSALPEVETDWCIPGVEALDATTCYVLPASPSRTLLVYLHGIVPPERTSPQKTNLETVLQNAARRAGIVAMLPRGVKGMAPRGYSSWYGWPSTRPSYQRHVKELVADIETKQKRMEEWLGAKFERRYVAGSSSGGYFAALLALHGGMRADGFGLFSGASGSATEELPTLPKVPVYVGFGKHDTVGPQSRQLAAVFERAGFPVRVAEHPVGHGAKEIYLDEALAFFREH
jgi:predicted esterase